MDHADYTSFAPASPLASGTPAPDFTLHSTPDQGVSLRDFRGRPVILVFYPADWSPICGDQVTLYNELIPEFRRFKAALIGISVDGVWCHLAFARDRKLQFPLLSDFEQKGARRWLKRTCVTRVTGRYAISRTHSGPSVHPSVYPPCEVDQPPSASPVPLPRSHRHGRWPSGRGAPTRLSTVLTYPHVATLSCRICLQVNAAVIWPRPRRSVE